jgi:glutamate-ammonia-ligase adenylyltransferase
MRLRPSGKAGPLATSLASFVRYQSEDAWTWEHMALTRARVVAGPAALTNSIEATIEAVLKKPRDRGKTVEDVRDMRARIELEKATRDIWDIKYHRGGQVDVEFIAQYLQLIHAESHPEVLDQNTITAIERLAGAGLIAKADAATLLGAAHLYHDLTQILRLCVEGPFRPETAPDGLKSMLASAAGLADFAAVETLLRDRLAAVTNLFDALIV